MPSDSARQNQVGGRSSKKRGPRRQRVAYEEETEQHDEQARLQQIARRRGRVLEIGVAVGQIGNGEERRLRRDAADRVRERELRVPAHGRGDRRRDPGQRRDRAEEHASHERLPETRPVGEPAGDRGETRAEHRDHERGDREESRAREKRLGHGAPA